ncbi:hypothetical protein MFUR16E_21685 [Methylobacterium fujisawaense]
MPSRQPTLPRPMTAAPSSLETTILEERAVGLGGWDARAAMARATEVAACRRDAPAMRLAA